MVDARSAPETVGIREIVRVEEYTLNDLRAVVPDWQSLSDRQRLVVTESDVVDPSAIHLSDNVTCVGLHRLLADALNANKPAVADIDALGIGTGTGQPETTDEELGNHVADVAITAYTDQGTTLETKSFIGSGVANGETISEVGLKAGPRLLTHSLLGSEIEKTNSKTATVTASVTLSAASTS